MYPLFIVYLHGGLYVRLAFNVYRNLVTHPDTLNTTESPYITKMFYTYVHAFSVV